VKSLQLDGRRRELKASEQVFPFEVGEFREQVIDAVARRQVVEHGLDRVTQSTNHGLAVTHGRIDGDTGEQAHVLEDTRIEAGGQGTRVAATGPT
jgi:hypothetical protein